MKHSAMHMYGNLILMGILSFISMFVLMYMMVDTYDNVFPNLNQVYMAVMLTSYSTGYSFMEIISDKLKDD